MDNVPPEDYLYFDDSLRVHSFDNTDENAILQELIEYHTSPVVSSNWENESDEDVNVSHTEIDSTFLNVPPIPSYNDAISHIDALICYSTTRQPDLISQLFSLKSKVEAGFARSRINSSSQSQISTYFKNWMIFYSHLLNLNTSLIWTCKHCTASVHNSEVLLYTYIYIYI